MAAKSPKKLSMLLIMVSMAMLVLTGRAQLSPELSAPSISSQLLSQKDAQRCLTHVADIEQCIVDILSPLFIGTISSACCRVVTEIGEDCLPKWFSFTPFFPPLLKSSCPPKGIGQFASAKLFSPVLRQPGGLTLEGVLKCWSSLQKVPGCILEVFVAVLTDQISSIGPNCCKAINEIDDKCWPKMFPVNPFFPPFIKLACSGFGRSAVTAPSPIGVGGSVSKFQLPWLLPVQPGTGIEQCWSSITNLPGCVREVLSSLFTTPPGIIGPGCCKAITEITDNCWTKMFPFTPFFPPLLKGLCPLSQGAPPYI